MIIIMIIMRINNNITMVLAMIVIMVNYRAYNISDVS